MKTEVVPSQTPEERELAKKQGELAALESAFAEHELDLATVRAELHAFEGRYLRIVGSRYAELDAIRAEIAEETAKRAEGDIEAKERAKEARAQADESASATGAAETPDSPETRFHPSENLKRLFREVAKRIHPDLATDDAERARRTELMSEANRAFEEGDEERLQAILREWQSSPEAVKGEGPAAELVRVIRRISQVETRIAGIGAEIEELENSEMHQLMGRVDEAESAGQDLLAQMAAQLNEQIAKAREDLTAIRRPGQPV